jgi:hypothetical protein
MYPYGPPRYPGPQVRFNADAQRRGIERRLGTSPEDGLRLYMERKRAGMIPEGGEGQGAVDVTIETPHGRLRIHAADADSVHLENRSRDRYADDHWSEPWVINRIPFIFSQHAKRVRGKWVVDVSSYGIYREGGGGRWEPSSSFRKKLKGALQKVLDEWSAKDDTLLRAGDLKRVVSDRQTLEGEINELMAKVEQKQLQIGALYLREVAIRGGGRVEKRMPSGSVLAEALTRYSELEDKAAAHLQVTKYDLRSWARGNRDKPTMVQRQMMFQLAKELDLDVAMNPRRRRPPPQYRGQPFHRLG